MKLCTYKLFKNAKYTKSVEIKGELLAKVQSRLLEVLKDFSYVCDKYGFYYSLCGGTALGAVRHGGFIPWDDDIDVFMLRKDYNKFKEIFESELSGKYYLKSPENSPESGDPTVKIMIKGTILRTYNYPDTKEGVSMDICILDNAPDNLLLRYIHGVVSMGLGFALSCSRFYTKRDALLKLYSSSDQDIIDAINLKSRIGKCLSFFNLKIWSKLNNKWACIVNNDSTKHVVCVAGVKHYFNEIFPRDKYTATQKIKFEDIECNIIKDYDWALTKLYGDYMKIPDEDHREVHSVMEIKI